MSRASEAAMKEYPVMEYYNNFYEDFEDINLDNRMTFQEGYEHAEKDIISLIESRIGEILGDAQPAPVLRAELRELINKIKEK